MGRGHPSGEHPREWRSGSASPCQGEGRGFKSRLPLHWPRGQVVKARLCKSLIGGSTPPVASERPSHHQQRAQMGALFFMRNGDGSTESREKPPVWARVSTGRPLPVGRPLERTTHDVEENRRRLAAHWLVSQFCAILTPSAPRRTWGGGGTVDTADLKSAAG